MSPVPQINYERPFQRHLRRGESLLWVGRPRQGIWFRSTDWVMVPFSAAFAAIALLIESAALGLRGTRGFNPCVATIGLPFAAIGLYMFAGRFFYDAWQRGRTWYGLTDRRALILYYGKRLCLNGVDLASPKLRMERQDHAGGTGTLIFHLGEIDPYWEGREGRSGFLDFGRPSEPAFEGIERVDEVQRMLWEAKWAAKAAQEAMAEPRTTGSS